MWIVDKRPVIGLQSCTPRRMKLGFFSSLKVLTSGFTANMLNDKFYQQQNFHSSKLMINCCAFVGITKVTLSSAHESIQIIAKD